MNKFKVKLFEYDRRWWSKELVAVMNSDEAEKIIEENDEKWISYDYEPLNDFQNRKLKELGKEKFEEIVRSRMSGFYTPAQYR